MTATDNQIFRKNVALALLYSSEHKLAQKIVGLRHSGMSIADISKKLDVSYRKVYEILF